MIEYAGEGVATLSVPERATITNMGAELGATTSIFPSDEITRQFLAAQGREGDFTPLAPDADAVYDQVLTVDLAALEPAGRLPPQPRQRQTGIRELGGIKVDQVCIGSCTNSSLYDMLQGGPHPKGQDGAPQRQPHHLPGVQAGLYHAGGKRRAGRS